MLSHQSVRETKVKSRIFDRLLAGAGLDDVKDDIGKLARFQRERREERRRKR